MEVEEVYLKVVPIVADVLAIDESEVELNKRLVADLGAESIDFLDFIFQLEKTFSVKIPRGQIEKQARGQLTDEEFEQKGLVTEKGLLELRKTLSEVPEENFKSGLKVNEIPMLFTVETLCKLVVNAKVKQEEKEAALV